MNHNEDQLYKDFEKEVWLYLDNQLDEKRKLFWDDKIENNLSLKNYMEEYISISNEYKFSNQVDIDENKFDLMIEKAIEKKSFVEKAKQIFSNIFASETEFNFGKIAFASFLIVAAVIISIISNRPNPVNKFSKTINSELLEWNPTSIEKKINKVENLLKLAKDEDYKRYSKYGFASENVDKNLNYIGNNIDELKKEINSKEL
ncbi:MAG: hypothetical protein IPH62_06845 [Ignavibacteriae bacterium]|nr:hypothetical protein [Ignavibacteriota bacterium]